MRRMDTEHDPIYSRDLTDDDRIRDLADRLDCLLDSDLCALARVKPTTSEAWRKRGIGPPYVLFGNRYLYPRETLRQFLNEHRRERNTVPAKSTL